ncbi:MAG: HAD-IIA family hydrolase [Actinomycetota bacterium]|nr:HAD-IIA family hydrolase [Actinomycetota bacterium]
MTVVVDLDGVVWRGDRPIPGSAEALDRLRAAGRSIVFLTNNSAPTRAANVAKLESFGVKASPDEVRSAAQAAALLVEPGERALLCAGEGVREALQDRGATVVAEGEADVVVVGWHVEFDFDRLTVAMRAVLGGARLVGTNEDATYPVPDGVLPGGGALLAAVSYASGARPVVAGKPHEPIVRLLKEQTDDVELVIGDRPTTDGLLARRLGVPYALVRTGIVAPGEPVEGKAPDLDEVDLSAVVDRLIGS